MGAGDSDEREAGPRRVWKAFEGYVVAIVLMAAMSMVKIALAGVFPGVDFRIPDVLIVGLVAYLYGIGPGLLAVALGAISFILIYVPPRFSLWPIEAGPSILERLGSFIIGAAAAAFAMDSLRRSRAGMVARRADLEREVASRIQTEQALRKSERKYRELFETMQEAMFVAEVITDEKGVPVDWRYVETNPQTERYMLKSHDEMVGHRYREIVPHPDPVWIATLGRVALTGEPVRTELYSPSRGRWLEISSYSPGPRLVATFFYDVTDRRMAQEELHRLNEQLEQRVAERTEELAAANKELEAFSYSVSHDLRAPLRAMDGFSDALLRLYADQLDERGRDYLRRVRGAAQRMGVLIDDILNLSRATRAEMHRQPVDLSRMAEELVAELARSKPDRQVQVSIEPGLTADADPHLLRIALSNLLGNAWKFTANRAQARIDLGVTEREGRRVYYVKDNGAGFDMTYADKLFTPFQRLHTESEFPGTGIGLALVKRIIRRHGGDIWAEGAVDQGATFYFTLGGSEHD